MMKVHDEKLFHDLQQSHGRMADQERNYAATPAPPNELNDSENDSLSTATIDARFHGGVYYFPEDMVDHEEGIAKMSAKVAQGQRRCTNSPPPHKVKGYISQSAMAMMVRKEEKRLNKLLLEHKKTKQAHQKKEYQEHHAERRRRKELELNRKRELQQVGRVLIQRETEALEKQKVTNAKQEEVNRRLHQILQDNAMERLDLHESKQLRYIRQCAKQQLAAQEKISDRTIYKKLQHDLAFEHTVQAEKQRRFDIEQKIKEEEGRLNFLVNKRAELREKYRQQKYELERLKYGLSPSKGKNVPSGKLISLDVSSDNDDEEYYQDEEGDDDIDDEEYDDEYDGEEDYYYKKTHEQQECYSQHPPSATMGFYQTNSAPPSAASSASYYSPMPQYGHIPMQQPQQQYIPPMMQQQQYIPPVAQYMPPQQYMFPPGAQHMPPPPQQQQQQASEPSWFYIDANDDIQGPFTNQRMRTWNERGLFPPDLLVQANGNDPSGFVQLGQLFTDTATAFQ